MCQNVMGYGGAKIAFIHLNIRKTNFKTKFSWQVQHKDKQIDAAIDFPPDNGNGVAIILTHGAGGDMNLKALISAADAMTKRGYTCVRFTCKSLNLVYKTRVFRSVLVSHS